MRKSGDPGRGRLRGVLAFGGVSLALTLLAACGAVYLPAAGSPSAATGQLYVASDSDNGRTLNVHVGDRLELKLRRTYWMIQCSHTSKDLQPQHAPGDSSPTSAIRTGGGCLHYHMH